MQILKSIQLCSRCLVHEINSWINDKSGSFNPEVTQKVREELKLVKLTQGNCIVCNSNFVSADCFESILKIFEKYKVEENLKEEFRKFFGFPC